MLLENDLEVWLRKANDKLDRIFFIEKEWKRRGERENKYLQEGRNYEWLLNLFKNYLVFSQLSVMITHPFCN